jgi:hypothetical protein
MTERKLGLALTLGIVLEVLEILRRTPRWLLVVIALVLYFVFYVVATHLWLTAAILAALFALRLARHRIAGRLRNP